MLDGWFDRVLLIQPLLRRRLVKMRIDAGKLRELRLKADHRVASQRTIQCTCRPVNSVAFRHGFSGLVVFHTVVFFVGAFVLGDWDAH